MKYSKLGYKRYSPDLYNKYNVIPSGRITMKDVDFPVYGVDNLGNKQMMYPGGEYEFPGNEVFEIPMAQRGRQLSASAGYDSWYNSPIAAGRYTFNPKDPAEYYVEGYGTKQGPGIAAGMDYTNPKYRTQAMIRAGLDPEVGANLRAQAGYRFNPIDNRREQLTWGPYGGVRFQTKDYQPGSNRPWYDETHTDLNYGVNARYNKALANRGRFSIEGDLGMGLGESPEANLGEGFDPRFYGAVKATYSPPMYKNTRNKNTGNRKLGPTTYSSGYQDGGDVLKAQKGKQQPVSSGIATTVVRNVLPIPENAAQFIAASVTGDTNYGWDDMDSASRYQLMRSVYNARNRTGQNKGGTEYIDYSPQVARDIENVEVSGPNMILGSLMSPEFKTATTLGRVSYQYDPATHTYSIYDSYDFNPTSASGSSTYTTIRNSAGNIAPTNGTPRLIARYTDSDYETYKRKYGNNSWSNVPYKNITDLTDELSKAMTHPIDYLSDVFDFKYGGRVKRYQPGGERAQQSFQDVINYVQEPGSSMTINGQEILGYARVNRDAGTYRYNSELLGDPEIQNIQKHLNNSFNLGLEENGLASDEELRLYNNYLETKPEEMAGRTITSKVDDNLFSNLKDPFSFRYDEQGNLQAKLPSDRAFIDSNYADWSNIEKLNPTVEEFKQLMSNVPKYNEYYENIYDVDPTRRGVQPIGPLDKSRTQQLENNTAVNKAASLDYLGKTFGSLPVVESTGIYEGYSPSRIWTVPPGQSQVPWLGDDSEPFNAKETPRYLYFLSPKEDSKWASEAAQRQASSLECPSGDCSGDYITPNTKPAPYVTWLNTSKPNFLKADEIPTQSGQPWRLGQQALVEMLNNPEIVQYAKENNINLTDIQKDQYSPILAEALIATRDAKFNDKGLILPDSRNYSPVIQNPEEFNFSGYLPLTMDLFTPKNPTPFVKGEYQNQPYTLNWNREELLRKAGIPEDQWDKVYMHTSPYPIEEYKPRGYQTGGNTDTLTEYVLRPAWKAFNAGADWLGEQTASAIKAASNYMDETSADVNQWFGDKIRPVEYPDVLTGAGLVLRGLAGNNAPPALDRDGDYAVQEEAWRKSLGLNPTPKYILPSEYRPSRSTDPNAQYYRISDNIVDPNKIIAYARDNDMQVGDTRVAKSLANYLQDGYMDPEEFFHIDPLANFTIGVGQDDKGRYVSMYDKYDFNSNVANAFITPFEIYNRYYYKKGGQHGGLDRWFAEKWVDIKTGKECGRQEGEKRGYPACRPSKRVSSKTPKTASELSSSEKAKFKNTKTSSKRIPYQHKRAQDGGVITRYNPKLYR